MAAGLDGLAENVEAGALRFEVALQGEIAGQGVRALKSRRRPVGIARSEPPLSVLSDISPARGEIGCVTAFPIS